MAEHHVVKGYWGLRAERWGGEGWGERQCWASDKLGGRQERSPWWSGCPSLECESLTYSLVLFRAQGMLCSKQANLLPS